MPDSLLIANLCFFAADGHNHFRVHSPSRRMAALDGVTVVDCDLYHRQVAWLADHADVLVLHGLNADWSPLLHRRRAAGRVTLFDASDDYLDIQPWRAYSVGWLDRSLQDLFWQTVGAVDAVQTSTAVLANRWRSAARKVLLFPNPVDDVPPLGATPIRPLTVGWAGSGTHLADWGAIAPQLQRWIAAHDSARLAVMTDERARGFIQLSSDRYSFGPVGILDSYKSFLQSIDIGIVPLLPGPFNAGRTDQKFLDYAAAGVAGIYPRAEPYASAIEDGRTGLLFDSPDELIECLGRLANDSALRLRIRSEAHQEAVRRRAADDIGGRVAEYRRLLGGPGKAPPLPDELRAAASVEGRYVRLEPAAPEQLVAKAVSGQSTESLAAELMELLRRHPDYLVAVRALSRVLNDLGRFGAAKDRAEFAVAHDADNPTGRIELARALLGLEQGETARYHLERAVVSNPRHPLAWHFLRELAADEDDVRCTATLWSRNAPSQYIPAIAAIATLPPEAALAGLAELIPRFTPSLHSEERPYAASAFGHAAAILAESNAPEELEPILSELCATFPESCRLADLHGECLFRLGRIEESDAAFARAAALHRVSIAARIDAESCESRVWRWQVAEYAKHCRAKE